MKAVFLDYISLAADDLDVSALTELPMDIHYFEHTSVAQTASRIADAEIIFSNKVAITEQHFVDNPQLKLIVILATGTNNVDLNAARAAQVQVSNIVNYSTQSVVQLCFSLILSLKTQLFPYTRAVVRSSSFYSVLILTAL